MRHAIRRHEREVVLALAGGEDPAAARDTHERWISYLQNERMAHLHVTLAFGFFLLLSIAAYLLAPGLLFAALAALLLVLLVPYVFHYFALENAVQRWYRLADELDARVRSAPGRPARGAARRIARARSAPPPKS